MISLIEHQVDQNKRQRSVRERVLEYLATGRPLDMAPDSILQDVDKLWEMLERARSRGVHGVRLSRELQSVARARAMARPMPDAPPVTQAVRPFRN